jgi:predicted HAD superfamily Cof-like phosphohydrolase
MTDLEKRLMRQVDDLQADNTRLVTENRALKAEAAQRRGFIMATSQQDRRGDVMQFFGIAGQEIGSAPHVPSETIIRFRLRLIAEEFLELLDASLCSTVLDHVGATIINAIDTAPVSVDMPAFADATIDLDYVVEGARVAFGIDGGPLWDLVHAANMAKMGCPKDPVTSKQLKPPGWKPPDIEGELRRQASRP